MKRRNDFMQAAIAHMIDSKTKMECFVRIIKDGNIQSWKILKETRRGILTFRANRGCWWYNPGTRMDNGTIYFNSKAKGDKCDGSSYGTGGVFEFRDVPMDFLDIFCIKVYKGVFQYNTNGGMQTEKGIWIIDEPCV